MPLLFSAAAATPPDTTPWLTTPCPRRRPTRHRTSPERFAGLAAAAGHASAACPLAAVDAMAAAAASLGQSDYAGTGVQHLQHTCQTTGMIESRQALLTLHVLSCSCLLLRSLPCPLGRSLCLRRCCRPHTRSSTPTLLPKLLQALHKWAVAVVLNREVDSLQATAQPHCIHHLCRSLWRVIGAKGRPLAVPLQTWLRLKPARLPGLLHSKWQTKQTDSCEEQQALAS